MDNKLSELSKPVQIFKHPSGRNFWSVSADSNAGHQGVEPFYSQEYVSALLAELEAKDKRITALNVRNAELNSRMDSWAVDRAESANRIDELEAKLATPVRLPTEHELHQVACSECAGNCLELVESTVRAAGFTVEGDEQ